MPTHSPNLFRNLFQLNNNRRANIRINGHPRDRSQFSGIFTFKNYAITSLLLYWLVWNHRFKQNHFHYELYKESIDKDLEKNSINEFFPFFLNKNLILNNFIPSQEQSNDVQRDIILELLNKHNTEKSDKLEGGVKSLFYDLNFFMFSKKANHTDYVEQHNQFDNKNHELNQKTATFQRLAHKYKRSFWNGIVYHYSEDMSFFKMLYKRLINHLPNIKKVKLHIQEEASTMAPVENDDIHTIKDLKYAHPNETLFNKYFKLLFQFIFDQWVKLVTFNLDTFKVVFRLKLDDVKIFASIFDKAMFTIVKMLETDYWISLNAAYCFVILFSKMIHKVAFGNLRSAEQIHLKDKICNFVFNKMIFMFALLNIDNLADFTLWMSWFSVTCFFHSTALLLKARLDYLSLSPRMPTLVKIKLGTLLAALVFWSNALTFAVVLAYMQFHVLATPAYLFLLYECIMLQLTVYHILYNVCINIYDTYHTGCWENKNQVTYYGDLIFGIAILFTDLLYHLHLLLWSTIILSMATLFICMELRWLYNELKIKIIKHKNYLRILRQMDKKYPMASGDDLKKYNNNCSICWDPMRRARKLPCDHLFHDSCLRSWLEHDSSCPICRRSLNPQPPAVPAPPPTTNNNLPPRPIELLPVSNATPALRPTTSRPLVGLPRLMRETIPPITTRDVITQPIGNNNNIYTPPEGITADERVNPAINVTPPSPPPIHNPNNNNYTINNNIDGLLTRTLDRFNYWNQRLIFGLIDFLFNASAALVVEPTPDNRQPPTTAATTNAQTNITGAAPNTANAGEANNTLTNNLLTIPVVTNNGVTVTRRVSRVNRLFHFDASRYVRWLPTFSLQVSHLHFLETPVAPNATETADTNARTTNPGPANQANTARLIGNNNTTNMTQNGPYVIDDMVTQVSHIFPHIPNSVIRSDLSLTWSVDQTIENILDGDLGTQYLNLEDEDYDEGNTDLNHNNNATIFSNVANTRSTNTFTSTVTADFHIGGNYPNYTSTNPSSVPLTNYNSARNQFHENSSHPRNPRDIPRSTNVSDTTNSDVGRIYNSSHSNNTNNNGNNLTSVLPNIHNNNNTNTADDSSTTSSITSSLSATSADRQPNAISRSNSDTSSSNRSNRSGISTNDDDLSTNSNNTHTTSTTNTNSSPLAAAMDHYFVGHPSHGQRGSRYVRTSNNHFDHSENISGQEDTRDIYHNANVNNSVFGRLNLIPPTQIPSSPNNTRPHPLPDWQQGLGGKKGGYDNEKPLSASLIEGSSPFVTYNCDFADNCKQREKFLRARKREMLLNARKYFICSDHQTQPKDKKKLD